MLARTVQHVGSMCVFRGGASNAAAGAYVVVLVAKEVLLAALVRAPFVVAVANKPILAVDTALAPTAFRNGCVGC